MDKQAHIAAIVATELGRFPTEERQAEALRWAVWLCWEDLGGEGLTAMDSMTGPEFADACAQHGIVRGSALNRYSDAKRNWKELYA